MLVMRTEKHSKGWGMNEIITLLHVNVSVPEKSGATLKNETILPIQSIINFHRVCCHDSMWFVYARRVTKRSKLVMLMQFHSWLPLPAPFMSSLKELKNKKVMLHRNHFEHHSTWVRKTRASQKTRTPKTSINAFKI